MNDREVDTVRLSDFVGSEPVVFMGCTTSELTAICLGSLGLAFLVFLFMAFALGNIPFSIGFSALLGLLAAFAAARILRLVKRGKPDNYYQVLFLFYRARFGLCRSLVVRSGSWGLGRSLSGRR